LDNPLIFKVSASINASYSPTTGITKTYYAPQRKPGAPQLKKGYLILECIN
jgi:hypothetical protein